MRLLIVDDQVANLRLLRVQLEYEGHQVIDAANGVEALALLEYESVDGVISDILMPQMDGYRLCIEIRKNTRYFDTPFVLYTSTYNSPADRKLAESAGADAYIEKPAPVQTLLQALQSAVKGPRPLSAPGEISDIEMPVLRQYSEALVRKLEEKSEELTNANAGLVQIEARLSGLVESAMDGIIATDSQQRVILFNAASARIFGCTVALAMGKPLNDFIPERFRDAHSRHIDSFGQETSPNRLMGTRQVWGLRSDGTEFPIEASISKLDTSQGRLYTVFIRDITIRHRAEKELAETKERFQQISESIRDVFFLRAADSMHMLYISPAYEDIWGRSRESLYANPQSWIETIHPDDRESAARKIQEGMQTGKFKAEYRIVRPNGAVRWIESRGFPVVDATGKIVRIASVAKDITDRREAERKISRLNRVYAVLSGINTLIVRARDREELFSESCRIAVKDGKFPTAWIAMVEKDSGAVRVAARQGGSDAYYAGLEKSMKTLASDGTGVISRVLRDMRPVISNDFADDAHFPTRALAVQSGSRSRAALPLITAGKAVGVLVLHADVADFFNEEEMKLLQELAGDISFALDHMDKSERVNYLANHDVLTGLSNRNLFVESLSQSIGGGRPVSGILAVVLLDMERFRGVNETLGRQTGDGLLRMVAARLQQTNPTVARTGPNQFALRIEGRQAVADIVRAVAEMTTCCFEQPFTLKNEELRIGCRIGVAVFPGDGENAETLLHNAEAALRNAKRTTERLVFYAPEMNAQVAQALKIESRLRRALERGEFLLHYQPKVSLSDRRIAGAEALIRWQDPQEGLIPPIQFIAVLEETGLIGEVGRWVMAQALKDIKAWAAKGLLLPRVAVNVSAIQLQRKDFVDAVVEEVQRAGDAPELLELEITESLLMHDVEKTIRKLSILRGLGMHISLDDFGTGYSSLSYLARLPIDTVKIDRSFIINVVDSAEDAAIVSGIVALVHSLKRTVVAEGVETEEQAKFLTSLGCDEIQGYLFSKPLPANEFEMLLLQEQAAAVQTHP